MSDESQQDNPVPEGPGPAASSEPSTQGGDAPTAPNAPAAPESPTMEQPSPATAEPAAGAAPRPEEDDVEHPAPAPAATTTSSEPPGFYVPRWVAFVAGGLLAALIFGGIGYAIGDSSGGGSSQNASNTLPGNGQVLPGNGNGNGEFPGPFANGNGPFGNGNGPFGNGNGNGGDGGNGNGGTTQNQAFLGVALEGTSNGVRITAVAKGSPAADAGLKTGDVITKINDKSVTTPLAARRAIVAHKVGDKVTITYTRDGKSATANATLGTRTTQN